MKNFDERSGRFVTVSFLLSDLFYIFALFAKVKDDDDNNTIRYDTIVCI